MTNREEELLRKLQAKKKREQRQEQSFWQTVDEKIDEVRAYVLRDILEKYGTNYDVWMKHITSGQQIDYFKKYHSNAQGIFKGETP
ncbi:MAG: hypothetical protein IIX48_02270 [Lachnospiraceae bacterium]|nr:hypothetical protein [Lachnospiraceae bacterium]